MHISAEVPLRPAILRIERVETIVSRRENHEPIRDGRASFDVIAGGECPVRLAGAGIKAVEAAGEVVVQPLAGEQLTARQEGR